MCGIAGQLGGADARAEAMISGLTHRGPDGIRIEQTPGAALAHARLSIIDLEGGWQPLHAAGSTIVGNGEIYNYVELREALPAGYSGWDGLCQAQYLEAAYLLPGYILSSQGDRVSMAHAVEGRFPFLDHRVVEFAWRLPLSMTYSMV